MHPNQAPGTRGKCADAATDKAEPVVGVEIKAPSRRLVPSEGVASQA